MLGLVVLAVMLVAACSPDPMGRAQEFADEHFPGELRVISAANDVGGPIPFPIIRATYAVVDDPDAYVELSSLREDLLSAAVREARWAASDMRAIREAMAAEGFTLVGLSTPNRDTGRRGSILVEAEVVPDDLDDVADRLDRALADWYDRTSAEAPLDRVSIKLVRPGNLDGLPAPDEGLPGILELTWPERLTALEEHVSYTTSVVSEGDGVQTVRAHLVPMLTDEQVATVNQAVSGDVTDWMNASGEPGVPGAEALFVWSFLIDGPTKLRTYVYICPETPDCRLPQVDRLGATTVDLETMETGDFAIVPVQRTPSGGVQLPVEPHLIPGR